VIWKKTKKNYELSKENWKNCEINLIKKKIFSRTTHEEKWWRFPTANSALTGRKKSFRRRKYNFGEITGRKKKVECQEISSRLKEKEKKISQLVIEDNQDELENFRKEKNMLEGELLATERDKSRLEQKLIEIQKRLQSDKKKFSKPLQEQPQKSNSSSTLSHEERAELEEKNWKRITLT